ncbi:MAG: response regulator [Hyphomicrobiales bacterium]
MKNKKVVLVIDDDLILVKKIESLLSVHNMEPVIATSGSEGIRLAFERTPDLILCDLRMPNVDGYSVFDILRKACVIYSTPFVFMSSTSEISEIRKGMLIGADDFIIKPFTGNDFINTINVRIEKSEIIKGKILDDMKQILNYSTDGLFLMKGDRIVNANQALFNLLGYSLKALEEKSISEFMSEEDFVAIGQWMEKIGRGINIDFRRKISLKTKFGVRYDYITLVPVKGYLITKATIMGVLQGASNTQKSFSLDDVFMSNQNSDCLRLDLDLESRFSDQDRSKLKLTKREKEVLELSCMGYTIKEVADKLFISDRTVEKHRSQLMKRFSANNFIEVILLSIKLGFVIV